ncbi:hypothetical protein BgiBS90_004292, partial [Biomphalaria glabrata]
QIETNTAKDLLIAYNSLTTQWEEVCQDNWTQAMSSLACSQLGYQLVHHIKVTSLYISLFTVTPLCSPTTPLCSHTTPLCSHTTTLCSHST